MAPLIEFWQFYQRSAFCVSFVLDAMQKGHAKFGPAWINAAGAEFFEGAINTRIAQLVAD